MEEIQNTKSEKRELRRFGVTLGMVLALWGGLLLWHKKDYYFYFFIFSGAFLFIGLFLPVLLKPVHKAWMVLTVFLGWLMNRVVLSVLFFLVVTPTGLLARLFGKNFLDLKFDKTKISYWIPRKTARLEKKSYENQF